MQITLRFLNRDFNKIKKMYINALLVTHSLIGITIKRIIKSIFIVSINCKLQGGAFFLTLQRADIAAGITVQKFHLIQHRYLPETNIYSKELDLKTVLCYNTIQSVPGIIKIIKKNHFLHDSFKKFKVNAIES